MKNARKKEKRNQKKDEKAFHKDFTDNNILDILPPTKGDVAGMSFDIKVVYIQDFFGEVEK